MSAAAGSGEAPVRGDVHLLGLLHDVGHELATLSLLVEAVRGDGDLSPRTRHHVELMAQETFRLLRLTRLATEAEARPVAVRELLGPLVAVAALSEPTSVMLRPGPPVTLDVDETTLWRIMTNLLGNAVRAAGPDGHVEVDVRDDEAGLVIAVTDDGPGFGQGPRGWRSRGLAIVRRLARACGAAVHIDPAQPRGTRVWLAFSTPLSSGEVRRPENGQEAE